VVAVPFEPDNLDVKRTMKKLAGFSILSKAVAGFVTATPRPLGASRHTRRTRRQTARVVAVDRHTNIVVHFGEVLCTARAIVVFFLVFPAPFVISKPIFPPESYEFQSGKRKKLN
jgi:hypothetical protein